MSEDRREPGFGNFGPESAGAGPARTGVSSPHLSLGQPPTNDDEEVSLLDILVVVSGNLRLLVFGPILAGLIALGYAFTVTPIFTARTSFFPPQQEQSASAAMLAQLGSLGGIAASGSGIQNPTDQYVALLKSSTIADQIVRQFGLIDVYGVDYRQAARNTLMRNTNISAGRDGLIVIEVDDVLPERAAKIANAYVRELQSLLDRLELTEAQQRRAFFEKQLKKTKETLAKAESALAAVSVTSQAIKANPETAVTAVARLQAQVTAQEVKVASMRGYLTESAPELVRAQLELAALRSRLHREASTPGGPPEKDEYIERYREFKYQETLFELFARQYELAKVDEARDGALIQRVDVATPPERRSKPARAKIAVTTSVGVGLILLIWVFMKHAVESSARQAKGEGKLSAVRAGIARLFFLKTNKRG